jgi:hypothetical protein
MMATLAVAFSTTVGGSAAILGPYSGQSEFGTGCDLCDSFVNFAVFENTGGNWATNPFFAGIAPTTLLGVTTGQERYVYMYQVVNNDPGGAGAENALRNYNIAMNPALATSGGYFSTAQFLDVGNNQINNTPNFALSNPDPALGNPDVANNGVPGAAGLIPLGIAAGNGINPVALFGGSISNMTVGGGIWPGLLWDFGAPTGVPVGATSSVLFFTSDLAPAYVWAESESPGGSGAPGDVSAPIPEPASYVMLGAGLLLLSQMRRWVR